jgi:hypothetical protein
MRILLLLLPLALLAPARAGQVDPSAYANAYCLARQVGADRDAAITAALHRSLDRSLPDAPKVNGSPLDALMAVQAALNLCPQFFVP